VSVEQALLAAVYADPSNDEPRLVYMDWLVERGDPRGEYIGLQLARHRSSSGELQRKEARREQALYEAHLTEWLGELREIVAVEPQQASELRAARNRWPVPPMFERGFLATATIRGDALAARTELARDPSLGTVIELCGDVDGIPCEDLPNLRRLRPRAGGPNNELIGWMDLVVRAPHLERIACNHTAVVRRDGALVVRITAGHVVRRGERSWFGGLYERSGAGWTIEFVTVRNGNPATHTKAIAKIRRELKSYTVTHVVDDAI
jgi:uncharacterized protein (TIGR02996 family)